jgi:hypothetical protein
MNRVTLIAAAVAILIGALAGYLWWGLPAGRLQSETREARTTADRVTGEVAELRAQSERLESRLKAETARREATEEDLRREKEMNTRLQHLISRGKK